MDLNNAIKDVINLDGYISATQEVANKSNLKVNLNITTVLSLKKIRSLEIEYFNKCDENGIACIIFECLLCTPSSKVWGVLAKELINLLRYWLEAIGKHLINHSTHWWMFLRLILKFEKEMYIKDPTIPDMLVEFTAECLFDLATAIKPDAYQRHEILHCLNMVCAAASREVRFAMRAKFGDYFVKIATNMATSGYFPYQYSGLECLLRWLLPRQERSLRAVAVDKWFPRDLCPDTARALFLNSSWMNFFQDARNFLNALNDGNGLVTSVVCRQLTIGDTVLINGTERQPSWLDFNTSVRSVSVLLDARELAVLGVPPHRACETVLIDSGMTETASLSREALGLTISLTTHLAPRICPCDVTASGRRLTAVVSSGADLPSLHRAMRTTFGDKYQQMLDLDTDLSQSPLRSYGWSKNGNYSEEETRFSHPVEVKRHKHAGYVVKTKYAGGSASPSTASTSSLIHLKDKLAALPRLQFDKDPVSVCAKPALSNVAELTEHDLSIYSVKTAKFQPYGVCHKSSKKPSFPKPPSEVKSRSDGELIRQRNRGGRRLISPVVSNDNATSLLLVATVGSDESVINDTIERLSKTKDYEGDNIVDLLLQEAFQAKTNVSDSGINTDEKKSQEIEAIDDTPNELKEAKKSRPPYKKTCTISTTDDESNTEVINETPAIAYTKKNIWSRNKSKTDTVEKQTLDVRSVEEFFSQHVQENRKGEIVISPTLAKKINETSSETSESIHENYLLLNEEVHTDIEQSIFDDIVIIDCLNEMVDKVCSNLDKYTESFYKKDVTNTSDANHNLNAVDIFKVKKSLAKPKPVPKAKKMKLKYKPEKKAKPRAKKKTKIDELKDTKKMSTIIEQTEEDTLQEINQETENENIELVKIQSPKAETPKCNKLVLLRRKRKLYSPKDDEIEAEIDQVTAKKTSDDVPLSEIKERANSKGKASCYKEIEKDRKKYTRLPRFRKSKGKVIEMHSPRSLTFNTMFDNLKLTIENNEEIKLVDKSNDRYNFTSDSEDEDFKKKKIEIKKRLSAAYVKSKSKYKNTRGKETQSSCDDTKNSKVVKGKKVTKRTNKQKTENKVAVVDIVKIDLVDERMREAVKEEMNTSVEVTHPINLEADEIEPIVQEVPQMEQMDDGESSDMLVFKKHSKKTERKYGNESNSSSKKYVIKTQMETEDTASNDTVISKKKVTKKTKKIIATFKKEKGITKKNKTIVLPDNNDRTSSPLPGLVVEESKPKCKDDINDSLGTNMIQKFKKIYRDGPDVNDSVITQNMLLDVEKINYSAYMNVTDDICFVDNNENITAENNKKRETKPVPMKGDKNITKNKIDAATVAVVEIHDIASVNKSDKSIATNSITAHGDDNEAPPATETLTENFQHRELPDLDLSMKDYFKKLTQEIYNSPKSRESSKSAETQKVGANKIGIVSPVVSIKRLSFEDLSKWMPSRRTSFTDSPNTSPIPLKKISETPRPQASVEAIPTVAVNDKISTPVSDKLKSPIVNVARISLEEFDKWLPMPSFVDEKSSSRKQTRGQLKLVYATPSETKIDTRQMIHKENYKTKKITAKPLRVETDNDNIKSTTDVCSIRTRSKSRHKEEPQKRLSDSDVNETRLQETKNKEQNKHKKNETTPSEPKKKQSKRDMKPLRKSPVKKSTVISPIKLFDDFVPNLESEDSTDNESVPEICKTTSKAIENKYSLRSTPKSKIETPVSNSRKRRSTSPILTVSKKRNIESEQRFHKSKYRIHCSQQIINESQSSDEPKKNIIEPKTLFDPRIDVLEDVTIIGSGPSSSSVNDWFKRTDSAAYRDASTSVGDTLQNVMEKLDTTFLEIKQNTSRKFVNLLVDTQKKMDVMSEQIAIFKEEFKEKAFELIRTDCQQTRATVMLLKDDVKAAMDYIEKKKGTDST